MITDDIILTRISSPANHRHLRKWISVPQVWSNVKDTEKNFQQTRHHVLKSEGWRELKHQASCFLSLLATGVIYLYCPERRLQLENTKESKFLKDLESICSYPCSVQIQWLTASPSAVLQQEILFSFNVIELLWTDFGLHFSHNKRVFQKQIFRICLQYFLRFVLELGFFVLFFCFVWWSFMFVCWGVFVWL